MQLPIEWLPAAGPPEQLILLLHGAGADGVAMAPLAQALRAEFPQAALLAPDAPGRHWLADAGDPLAALAAALPPLWRWVQQTQQRLGVAPAATAIAGFGQGATLALETAVRHDGLAGRVLAFGGCFAELPAQAPRLTTVHLFHGSADSVIPVAQARVALERFAALQADATMDIGEGIAHELHPALLRCALHRLRNHIPLRTWQAALGAVPPIEP